MMLGLELRKEFKGRRLKGTAIELTNKNKTGATQVPASDFLKITYPTADVLKTIEAVGPNQGRPVTLKGERGQGKSHLMAMIYHAFTDNTATSQWLSEWGNRLSNEKIADLPLRSEMVVISESLHRQHYKFLWDLIFEQHPHGGYCRGKWESSGDKKTDVPSDEILFEMFKHTPTALILDEFQTWYDGLTNTKQYPWRNWAFNFIQILSEIAKEHPDLLVLVISVRNGNTDAFQQVQRVNPVIVDFKGPSAKQDRLRLLLHRLFDNRIQVADDKIAEAIETHISEYIRLKDIAPAEHQRTREEFIHAWPYAPHLMELLEDQVLMATHAQETRDLIRILADLFKRRGEDTPIITAADFRLDDDSSGITALLDSVANQHHAKLREKAMRNLEAVRDAVANTSQKVPHLEGIIGALWLRSLAESNLAGADMETLHVDITRSKPADDNAFHVELSAITENSFNIHEDGNRYIFREEENPQAKLIASARNDKLFQEGEDVAHLSKGVRYVIGGSSDVASRFRVIVLPQYWASDPWERIEESERPNNWDDRIPVLVLPKTPDKVEYLLGEWLRNNLQANRNAVRFLLPRDGSENIFGDRDLIVLARAVYLAEKWRGQNPEYGRLQTKYQKELREILKTRFDRFAVISNWNFQDPKNCRFYIESHKAEGAKIPDAIDKYITENLFIPEDFENFVLAAAPNNEPVGKLMRELREPRPGKQDCIPWLGETLVKERIIRLCARGKIAINLRGMEYLQLKDAESDDEAWRRMRGKLGTGKHLDETYILLPQAVPATAGGTTAGGEQPIPPAGGQPPVPTPGGTNGPVPGGEGGEQPHTPAIFGGTTTFTPLSTSATSAALIQWWESQSSGRAVLILDGLSLRECPWIIHGATERGFTVHDARVTGAELPADTTPFAKALGFSQRSALGNNGAGSAHKLTGARTESTDIAWKDCADFIGSEPDWVFWHHWPDHRLHDHDEAGKGLSTLTREVREHLTSDDFWSLVKRLSTGRRVIITSDHGYAASGLFPDSDKNQTDYLKKTFKSGRWIDGNGDTGHWVPPIDLSLNTRHGWHQFVLGRRKWKSAGGYPTLTHGGLSVLEVAVPFIEISHEKR